jgi:hypothetical protein
MVTQRSPDKLTQPHNQRNAAAAVSNKVITVMKNGMGPTQAPFQVTTNTGKSFTGRHNPNVPAAFNTPELQKLKAKMSDVTLSDIVHKAGIKGGPSQLTTTGLPNKLCLNWACMGKCPKSKCDFDHPASVDNAVTATVYQQMEPGIKRLLEMGKNPNPDDI